MPIAPCRSLTDATGMDAPSSTAVPVCGHSVTAP